MLDKLIDELAQKQSLKKDQMLIEDVIDIYNHKYKNYDDYYKQKQNLLEAIRREEENQMMNIKENNYLIKLYVHPVILDKEIFDYAYSLGKTISV